MYYTDIKEAIFLNRPNRFIANIQLDGRTEICHVKNTGRCKELLLPGAKIYVQQAANPNRKTKYSLISVYKGDQLVNIDSQAPNKVFAEWLAKGGLGEELTQIKAEYNFLDSRLDFYAETPKAKILIETKGVTLEEDGVALFPDAPTERGVKHLETLINSLSLGYRAYAVFVIQMKGVSLFSPNGKTHPAFAHTLKTAQEKGVNILALDCQVTKNSITIHQPIPTII
ncbi:MAG: DNA/RNA nuclease SfsA [Bacillota bacterium]